MPDDLDIYLCYGDGKGRHINTADLINGNGEFSVSINQSPVKYVTNLNESGHKWIRSKTFKTESNVPIQSIDITRKFLMSNVFTVQYPNFNILLDNIKNIMNDYDDDPEYHNNENEEFRKFKLDKHLYKRAILDKISVWFNKKQDSQPSEKRSEKRTRLFE